MIMKLSNSRFVETLSRFLFTRNDAASRTYRAPRAPALIARTPAARLTCSHQDFVACLAMPSRVNPASAISSSCSSNHTL